MAPVNVRYLRSLFNQFPFTKCLFCVEHWARLLLRVKSKAQWPRIGGGCVHQAWQFRETDFMNSTQGRCRRRLYRGNGSWARFWSEQGSPAGEGEGCSQLRAQHQQSHRNLEEHGPVQVMAKWLGLLVCGGGMLGNKAGEEAKEDWKHLASTYYARGTVLSTLWTLVEFLQPCCEVGVDIILSPFYRWVNWDLESLGILTKTTQGLSRAEIWIKSVWSQGLFSQKIRLFLAVLEDAPEACSYLSIYLWLQWDIIHMTYNSSI